MCGFINYNDEETQTFNRGLISVGSVRVAKTKTEGKRNGKRKASNRRKTRSKNAKR